MNQLYFEAKGEALLETMGLSKSEFARRMGIKKQNVKSLFKTKNLETIYKAADVLGMPFLLLVGYVEEPDLNDYPAEPVNATGGILEETIPTGNTIQDQRIRHKIILSFYHEWKKHNPDAKKYNLNLKDDINIRYVSLEETAGQASLTYLSTLAVLQLDAILTNAVLVEKTPSNPKKKNQKGFESLLRMSYYCPGLGMVKMLVGVKRSDKTKVQYCITAIDTQKTKQEVA